MGDFLVSVDDLELPPAVGRLVPEVDRHELPVLEGRPVVVVVVVTVEIIFNYMRKKKRSLLFK